MGHEVYAESSNGRTRRSDRRCVGSNPTSASSMCIENEKLQKQKGLNLDRIKLSGYTEVIRLDEELVLKTGDGDTFVGSSPTASAK